MERNTWVAAGTLLLLSGCGGGGSSLNTPPPSQSPGGIWRGNESVSGKPVIGIVDEAGDFQFIRSDGLQYVGTATVSGNSLNANLEGIVPLGFAFTDGSKHGTGTVAGTLTARTSIQSNTTFTTDNNSTNNGTLNLSFDPLYNRASALSTASGTFTDVSGTFTNAQGQNTLVVTVRTDGSMFAQDPPSGCVLNGTLSIINATYNAYKVQADLASCTGTLATLNGVQFNGFAMLDNTLTPNPEQLLVAATGASGNLKYSLVLRLNRN